MGRYLAELAVENDRLAKIEQQRKDAERAARAQKVGGLLLYRLTFCCRLKQQGNENEMLRRSD